MNDKLKELKDLKQFCIDKIDIDMLNSKQCKAAYIHFLSAIQEDIEEFQLKLGIINQESLNKAVENLKKKWSFPIGITD